MAGASQGAVNELILVLYWWPSEQVKHSQVLGQIQLSKVWYWKTALSKSVNVLQNTHNAQSIVSMADEIICWKILRMNEKGAQSDMQEKEQNIKESNRLLKKLWQKEKNFCAVRNKHKPVVLCSYLRGNIAFCLSLCTACRAAQCSWPWALHLNARLTPSTLAQCTHSRESQNCQDMKNGAD